MWDRKGLSEALSELLILAVAIVVLSALAYFWTDLALPSAKTQLEVKGCAGKIVIYVLVSSTVRMSESSFRM